MKKLFFLLLSVLFCSCEKNKPDNSIINETDVDVSVLDESGNDLLNPTLKFPKSINTTEIAIYFVVNERELLVDNELLDASKGYRLLKPEGDNRHYRLRIFLNTLSTENITKTIIQWDKDQRDVLKAEMNRNKNMRYVTKIWLNETLVWKNEGVRFITVKK